LSYSVLYQDIGVKDYKEAWELQDKIFRKLIDNKMHENQSNSLEINSDSGTLIFVEHPHVYTLGKIIC
jgi:lipoyl(octanoyl) transferase